MNRSVATLSREQIITRGEALCTFFSTKGSASSLSKKKVCLIVLSKLHGSNEDVHLLKAFASGAKKGTQNQDPLYHIIITKDNLCGVINDTECTQPSGKATVVKACPFLAVVTQGGTLVIRQPNNSSFHFDNHDTWYKSVKQQLNFNHSWPVLLESSSSTFPVEESRKAFVCLNRHTLSVVTANGYLLVIFCSTADCRFKTESYQEYVLLTIKRITTGSESKCVVRINAGIAKSFLRAVGYWPDEYVTTEIPPALPAAPREQWTIIQTITAVYNGKIPSPDTLKLSYSLMTQLGLKLMSQQGQPSWRDLADRLGMTQDDIDYVIRTTTSHYHVLRYNPEVMMLPAIYMFYHWQYVFNLYGEGEPPKMPLPCNKYQLKLLLRDIGRNDLVQLIDEWEKTLTPI